VIAAAKGFGGRGYGYSKLKRKWTDDVALLAKAARLPKVTRARFSFQWFERSRRRNPDNFCAGGRKMILDGLVNAGVLENDGWTQIVGWRDEWVLHLSLSGVAVQIEPV
jgi:hypothetical protein